MSSRFSGIGSEWYNDEVGDDEFDLLQTHMAPEDNGEVTIFDINGGIQRVTKSIGAKWYYAKDTMTVDDCKPYLLPQFPSLLTISSCSWQRSVLRTWQPWKLERSRLHISEDSASGSAQAIALPSHVG